MKKKLLSCCILTILTLSIFSSLAIGRPGGGSHYSGGGRSSGGGYSGGYSSSSRFYSSGGGSGAGVSNGLLFFVIAIMVGVGIISAVASAARKKRANVLFSEDIQNTGLDQLIAQDHAFSEDQFATRVKLTMAKVNEAWLSGSMKSARRIISDGVYTRFQTQLNMMRSYGMRNVMVDWQVLDAKLVAATSDRLWDTVHFKVVGQARDRDVSIELSQQEALHEASKANLEQYEEVWSFIRRRGLQSKNGVPALEGQCPSCGAELPLAETMQCAYCKAVVNSGEHDFVLAEITQPEEWNPYSTLEVISGLDSLQQKDPSVSPQELEDRASMIFWKWLEARTTGSTKHLARFCRNEPDEAVLNIRKTKLTEIAVGSADLRQVQVGKEGEDFDKVRVSLRWSARHNGGGFENQVHLLTLSRATETKGKPGLSSLDCPVCKGPLAESDAVTCTYCGEKLMGGKHEWLLESVVSLEE